jgi:hypothetical protein
MNRNSKIIHSNNISLADVPDPKDNMKRIFDFALTFDPKELKDQGANLGKLDDVNQDSTLSELRAHLYFEQRRWNHYGRLPDSKAETQFRRILRLIREKLHSPHVS